METIAPRWKGRLDPDGRFAVWPERGMDRSNFRVSKEKSGDKTNQALRNLQAAVGGQVHDYLVNDGCPGVPGLREFFEVGERQRAMGSPKLFNSEKPRAPRGSTGITPHGRRKVRCGIGLMEFRAKTRNMSLYTGTFPAMSQEEWASVASDWSRGVDAFLRGIAYYLKKAGIRPSFVGCVELQSERCERTGELGLHLHVVWQGRLNSKHDWAITPRKAHEIWKKTWERHAPTAQHWCVGNKLEAIVHSAAAYLGKYLSKGCAAITRAQEASTLERIVPSWYVCSREISRWVEKATLCSSAVGDYLRRLMKERSKAVVYSGVILRETADGRVVVVSGYGQTTYRNWSVPPPWVEGAKMGGTAQWRKADAMDYKRYGDTWDSHAALRCEPGFESRGSKIQSVFAFAGRPVLRYIPFSGRHSRVSLPGEDKADSGRISGYLSRYTGGICAVHSGKNRDTQSAGGA